MLPETSLLRAMRNMGSEGNEILKEGMRLLQGRLPAGWSLDRVSPAQETDARLNVVAPDGRRGTVSLEVRTSLDPRDVLAMAVADRWLQRQGQPPLAMLVVARYLSQATRERLIERGFGFLDLTGNIRLELSEPGLFIEATGASANPERDDRPARSLKGPKAGRVVRALVDFRTTPGVRKLAVRAGVDAGYLSRVLSMMDRQTLIERGRRGRVERVDWIRLLRRWAADAPLEARGPNGVFLEPRGLKSLLGQLAATGIRHVVTGSLAASRQAPVAPSRLATVYLEDMEEAAEQLGLRPTDSGGNVLLVQPADDVVFDRCTEADGVWYVAPSQAVADLLTSPGRGPAEAEALIEWMRAHEDSWRG